MICTVDVALPNWSVKHLSCWNELVDVKMNIEEVSGIGDLEAAKEATAAAMYQEIRSKIA